MKPDSKCLRCREPLAAGERMFCEKCASQHRAVYQAQELEERRRRFAEQCPPSYVTLDPNRLPCTPEKLQQVLAWKYGERGLLLHGETGTGKTRCAWSLLRRLYVEDGLPFVAFDAVNFSHIVARQFSSDAGPDAWLENIYSAPIVFLDDVGKCRLTERGESELFGLVENRTANRKPIICTTNFVGNSLAETMRHGAPLVRRLREFCECISFGGRA